jgi:UDP-N-acetylmuramate-alanine ligase
MTASAGSKVTVALVQRRHSRHRAFFLEALKAIDDVAAVALLDPAGESSDGTAAEARSLLGEAPGTERRTTPR